METSTQENERLERLVADYRRLSAVYGVSIISIAGVITAMVWSTPHFQIFPSFEVIDTEAYSAASVQKALPVVVPQTTASTPPTRP